ncbi:MAG TPA: protein-disulfide reductase DsbD domain-containing protein [Opitutales bacterium]|jgi:thiol:disulfide interchange protein|nr:protein-disulfide reductase DsbD domain-containing protein [Opitutales bacterium]
MKIVRSICAKLSQSAWIAVLLLFISCAGVTHAADIAGVPNFITTGEKVHTQADLIAETSTIAPGQPFTVALRLKMDTGWHTYWSNPIIGIATNITWQLPPGWQASPIQWPTPEKFSDGSLVDYVYEGTALLLVEIIPANTAKPGDTAQLAATVNWLECADECIQQHANVTLTLPIAATAQKDAAQEQTFTTARAALPQVSNEFKVSVWQKSGKLYLGLESLISAKSLSLQNVYFFPTDDTIKPTAPQILHQTNNGWVLELERKDSEAVTAKTLSGVLTLGGPGAPALAVAPKLDSAAPVEFADFSPMTDSLLPARGLPLLLFLGFCGGLILNIMPCVFPVLGIKVLGIVKKSGAARSEVIKHSLVFTGGVLVSMWALVAVLFSLRSAGAQLGWGFQLQSPAFVIGLTIFFLLFGLSLNGVFEIGGSLIGAGSELTGKAGLAGAFFQGVLAVVVATPCTAPLLAPALGAAFTLPTGQAFVVFTAIALGLSFPYLMLSLFPGMASWLPKPGAWMETFKQLMAFPLYATVAFLLYTLAGQVSQERYLDLLFGLVLTGLAAWCYGRYAIPSASLKRRSAGRIGALLLLAGGIALAYWPIQELGWEPWSSARVVELQKEGRPIYVDFTARWCLTCQVNKDAVFHSTDRVAKEFNHENVAMLRADMTVNDPLIVAELARFGRASVPLDLLYLPGKTDPVILPSVLTPGIVLDALAGNPPPSK